MATSFISVTWCCSSSRAILSTLLSTLAYWAFMVSSLLPVFLKRPNRPFFSSSSPKPFSSTTSSERDLPTSPRSLVRTEARAFSEKPATFFWAAAPYWRIMLESMMLIFLEKSSTAFFSASFSRLSSICTGAASGLAGSAGAEGSRVSSGTAWAAAAWGSSVSWGMLFSLIAFSSIDVEVPAKHRRYREARMARATASAAPASHISPTMQSKR